MLYINLDFLIRILIMMSFSFSLIPSKNGEDSLVQDISLIPSKNGDDSLMQDVMLSFSNLTLLLLYFTCYSGAQVVVCLMVGV
jgi:hypothetical protein